jgi:hypothetical protein
MCADFVLLPALLLMVAPDKVPARDAQALSEPNATIA